MTMMFLETIIRGQITNSTFKSKTDTIVLTGGKYRDDLFQINGCVFSADSILLAIIISNNSPLWIVNSTFNNSFGTLVKHMGPAKIILEGIIATNITCRGYKRGCLLEVAASDLVILNHISVSDMKSERASSSVISLYDT